MVIFNFNYEKLFIIILNIFFYVINFIFLKYEKYIKKEKNLNDLLVKNYKKTLKIYIKL